MSFKLDTGAEGTATTEPAFLPLKDVPLQAPTKTLLEGSPIKSLGTGHPHLVIKRASLHPQSVHSQRSGVESIRPTF